MQIEGQKAPYQGTMSWKLLDNIMHIVSYDLSYREDDLWKKSLFLPF